jgi:hypothetical protein
MYLGAPRLMFCSIAKTKDAGLSPRGLLFTRLRLGFSATSGK